ncbi:MAG: hypothetical protein APF76_06665 [Desulfitibacter sp. BRH_c19]|nr:MAG: hypothetical protein APF76_06665 [Desulfitibacter sp. BRH_c19]
MIVLERGMIMANKDKDIKILVDFIDIYCKKNHEESKKYLLDGHNILLCKECMELALYAIKKRKFCKKDPKPACKKCDTPCYSAIYRDKIRKIMKFSGIYYVKRGRLDYLYHYLF